MLGGSLRESDKVHELARRHLHGARDDDVDRIVDGRYEAVERDGRHLDAARLLDKEGKEVGGELDLRHEHMRSVRQRSGHEADQPRHRSTDGDELGLDADQPGKRPPGTLGRLAPTLPARPTALPVGQRFLERVPGRLRREAEARRVQIDTGRAPE